MRRTIFIVLGIIILVVILFRLPIFPSWIEKGFVSVASPFWKLENAISLKMSAYDIFFTSKRKLLDENEILREEIKKRSFIDEELKLLRGKNDELESILNRRDGSKDLLLATVLSKPNRSPYDTLILDVGRNDGVSSGDRVLADGAIIIGIIDTVFDRTSRVKLFSSPGEEVEVTIGYENVSGLARGVGAGNFEVRLPSGIDIFEGDVVLSPALHAQIIGVVEKIQVERRDSFQIVHFKNPVNIFELRFVGIERTFKDILGNEPSL